MRRRDRMKKKNEKVGEKMSSSTENKTENLSICNMRAKKATTTTTLQSLMYSPCDPFCLVLCVLNADHNMLHAFTSHALSSFFFSVFFLFLSIRQQGAEYKHLSYSTMLQLIAFFHIKRKIRIQLND